MDRCSWHWEVAVHQYDPDESAGPIAQSEDWPKNILLRLPDTVYVFAREGERVAVRAHLCPTLKDAETFSEGFDRTKDIILLALDELESDPKPRVPSLLTLSA
jgi:hypothetical protein